MAYETVDGEGIFIKSLPIGEQVFVRQSKNVWELLMVAQVKPLIMNSGSNVSMRAVTRESGPPISAFQPGTENSDLCAQCSTELAYYGKLLHQRGYVSGTDGNLSARLGPEHILITAGGVSKGFMQPQEMVLVTLDGKKVAGYCQPSSEIGMHLTIYKMRPDVAAVVHAHPPIATGFACAGLDITEPVYSELLLTLGEVPLAPYATPGTDQLGRRLEPFILDHDAILLQNHGVVAYSVSLKQAYLNMETVEHCAKITLMTKFLGRCTLLNNKEIKRLNLARLKKKADLRESAVRCIAKEKCV